MHGDNLGLFDDGCKLDTERWDNAVYMSTKITKLNEHDTDSSYFWLMCRTDPCDLTRLAVVGDTQSDCSVTVQFSSNIYLQDYVYCRHGAHCDWVHGAACDYLTCCHSDGWEWTRALQQGYRDDAHQMHAQRKLKCRQH